MRGLYVHVPFCVSKCRYCDFYSLAGRANDRRAYLDAVLAEASSCRGTSFQSLYLGGGTPSLLGSELLEHLINGLNRTFDLTELEESTIEVNPDSASAEFLIEARRAGINRISIGVQSLNDQELGAVGRIHTGVQAVDTVKLAVRTGFDSVSADLIAGLPGQSWPALRHSLETIINSGVDHISLYCLSVEPCTPLSANPPVNLPGDDAQADMFERAVSLLHENGFSHYEISNFARQGHECKHNLNYWRGGEYFGLGPAAASHIDGVRFRNRRDLAAYIENPCGIREDVEELNPETKAAEEAMLRLRLLREGVDIEQMAVRFGRKNVEPLVGRLKLMVSRGELVADGAICCLPPSRVLTSNSIFAKVLV